MALTADREYETIPRQTYTLAAKAGAADTLYKGALLNWGTNGLLKVAADVAAECFAGVNKKQVVADGTTNENMEVERGLIWIAHSGAAQTDVGALFYATADDTLADSASNVGAAGLCVGWKSGYVLINTDLKTV